MRALVVCLPGVGHVRPMVPVARALRDGGHDVLFATGRDFQSQVAAAGLRYAPAGPTRNEAKAERLRRHPESTVIDPTEQQRFHVRKVWAGIYAPVMLDDLMALIARWRPDLIVYDAMAFAAPLAAARSGVPAVSHSTGPAFAADLLAEATRELGPLWTTHGLTPPRAAGMYDTLHLDVWPAALQLADAGDRGEVLPIATPDDEPAGGEPVPDWFADLDDRPAVHLTLGTVFNGNVPAVRTVVEALRDDPVNLLVSVGPGRDPAELGRQPGNVRVERWLPHGPLLPRCSLVICHGGAGTTLKSLRLRLPLLLLPQGADMFRTARACTAYGVARWLAPNEVTVPAVRATYRQLRDDPTHRRAGERMSAELDQSTPPEKVVSVLEELVGRWPGR